MGKGRDRPRHQEKRKPKEKSKLAPPPTTAYQQSMSVELIKPRRKPRSTEPGPSE
jgi:hypothetical protein